MPASSITGFDSLPARLRAFVALKLDGAVDDAVAALIERLHACDGAAQAIRWVRRENFHLTLCFLGAAVPSGRLLPVAETLADIAGTTEPFQITARGIGAFPSLARPAIIWTGLEGAELRALAGRVAEGTLRCGFARERRVFSPHLTIGRVRSPRLPARLRQMLREEADLRCGISQAARMILYSSELGPNSSTYRELAVFPFGAPGQD